MKRLQDWQLRLEAFWRERKGMPFAWGRNDCALFAADAVETMTGERLLPELRCYADAEAAAAVLRAERGLRAVAGRALGAEIPPAMARIGDVVLMGRADGNAPALTICNGSTAMGPGVDGLVVVSMAGAVTAWRVG